MAQQRERLFEILIPLAVLAGLTVLFRFTNLDIRIMRRFYVPGAGWSHAERQPWPFLYEYGTLPAQAVEWLSVVVILLSFRFRRLRPYRITALFFVLVMVVGPGLLVNTAFKQHWGRPRPLDLREFGGDKPFRPVWIKVPAGDGESFPSGHAAMGFFWLTPYFVLRRIYKRRAVAFLLMGLGYGLLMGLGRIAQGSHFPSDVLWAFGFVYLSALGFDYLLKPNWQPARPAPWEDSSPNPRT
jgi:lipid A 4'-phosphatase